MQTNVIETHGLTRQFRNCLAVDQLSLTLPQGAVFAFLGPNGAGKTTTIKMLMNMIRPSRGEARVLSVPSTAMGQREFERIGYVSENQQIPEWMTLSQLLAYLKPLYPRWDDAFCASLGKILDTPMDQRLSAFSRGMKMKAKLLASMAYRPQLLVMDEPFSGLDPLVREELIQAILELTTQEQWTIFISSQDVDEVERLADRAGFLFQGRMALAETVESLQQRYRRIELTTEGNLPTALPPNWLAASRSGRRISVVVSDYHEDKTPLDFESQFGPDGDFQALTLSLKELYLVLAKAQRDAKTPVSN